jgi:hypothetical protein
MAASVPLHMWGSPIQTEKTIERETWEVKTGYGRLTFQKWKVNKTDPQKPR